MKAKFFYGPGGPAGLIGNFLVRKDVESASSSCPS